MQQVLAKRKKNSKQGWNHSWTPESRFYSFISIRRPSNLYSGFCYALRPRCDANVMRCEGNTLMHKYNSLHAFEYNIRIRIILNNIVRHRTRVIPYGRDVGAWRDCVMKVSLCNDGEPPLKVIKKSFPLTNCLINWLKSI